MLCIYYYFTTVITVLLSHDHCMCIAFIVLSSYFPAGYQLHRYHRNGNVTESPIQIINSSESLGIQKWIAWKTWLCTFSTHRATLTCPELTCCFTARAELTAAFHVVSAENIFNRRARLLNFKNRNWKYKLIGKVLLKGTFVCIVDD